MPPKRTATNAASAGGGRKKGGATALYELAEPFSNGTILTDLCRKTWSIGNAIGQGGFGCIYECRSTSSKTPIYVVKVEPDSNGPLFCEMHFYLQLGKQTLQDTFIKANQLDHLGVPQLIAHGMHESLTSKRRYRFLIIPRYKQTLAAELQLTNTHVGHCLDEKRVQSIGKQMLDIFEYIHSHGYVHADIKAENILLNDAVHIYLLDYGLSRKAALQYEEKVQRRHEGTLEFTSLDVHRGAIPSFRGDLEILFYNMLHWLGGRLPWLTITDGVRVQQAKTTARTDPAGFIRNIFTNKKSISAKMLETLTQFFREIIQMNYTDKGDYRRLREIITGKARQRRSSIGAVSSRKPLVDLENDDDDDEEAEEKEQHSPQRKSPRRSTTTTTTAASTTRARSVSRDRRKSRNETRSPSPPIQILSARTPTLKMLDTLPNRLKNKPSYHDIEDDENDIDMSAILHPKLSSTRIERPRRVHAPIPTPPPPPKVTNDYYNKAIHLDAHDTVRHKQPVVSTTVHSNTTSKNERHHSDIIEKVLAGIPLSDKEIRSVIHRSK